MAMCKGWIKEGPLWEFWNGAHLENEEREDLEIRGFRRLQEEWERLGMGRQRRVEKKKNTFTLGT